VNAGVVPPLSTVAEVGAIDTEVRVGKVDGETVMMTAGLCLVIPPRVALTKSPTVPAVVLALNVTGFPEDELRVPNALFERDQE